MCLKGRKLKKEPTILETFEARGSFASKPLPKEIEVSPTDKELLKFSYKDVGDACECVVTIKNKYANKFTAFKFTTPNSKDFFRLEPCQGTVAPGATKTVTIHYNTEKLPRDMYYFLVFFAVLDTDELPKDYKREPIWGKTGFPDYCDAFQSFGASINRDLVKPLPDRLRIFTLDNDMIVFKCGAVGKAPDKKLIIISNHTGKFVAFRANLSAPTRLDGKKLQEDFCMFPSFGVVATGGFTTMKYAFANKREPVSDNLQVHIFVKLVDSDKLPDDFNEAVPLVFDGSKLFPIDISYDAGDAFAPEETSQTGRTGQTVAQTTTAGDPAAAAAAAAAAGAAPAAPVAAAAAAAAPVVQPAANVA